MPQDLRFLETLENRATSRRIACTTLRLIPMYRKELAALQIACSLHDPSSANFSEEWKNRVHPPTSYP